MMDEYIHVMAGMSYAPPHVITGNGFEYDRSSNITDVALTDENVARINGSQTSVQEYAASREFLNRYQADKHKDDGWYSHNLMWHEIEPSIRRACRKNNESWWCIFGIHKYKPVDESDIMLVCERCGHAKIVWM